MSLPRVSLHRLRMACAVIAGAIAALAGGCSRVEPPKAPPPNAAELNESLRDAAAGGEAERVRTLLAQGAVPSATNAEGRTALMLAAFDGHVEVVRLLLVAGTDVKSDRPTLLKGRPGQPVKPEIRKLLGNPPKTAPPPKKPAR